MRVMTKNSSTPKAFASGQSEAATIAVLLHSGGARLYYNFPSTYFAIAAAKSRDAE
jgi:hypothetical protein